MRERKSMAQYWIERDGVRAGPFDEGELRAQLARDLLDGADLAWTRGMWEWRPLAEVLSDRDAAEVEPRERSPYRPPAAPVDAFALDDDQRRQRVTRLAAAAALALVAAGAMLMPRAHDVDPAVRHRVNEALATATAARSAVARYIDARAAVPATLEAAGFRFAPGAALRDLRVDPGSGAIVATLAFPPLEGATVLLVPVRDAGGQVAWHCRAGSAPASYLPPTCTD